VFQGLVVPLASCVAASEEGSFLAVNKIIDAMVVANVLAQVVFALEAVTASVTIFKFGISDCSFSHFRQIKSLYRAKHNTK
jgi:hypothetical protein